MPQKTPIPKTVPARSNPPHKSYKHIAVIFVVLALLLILGVTYLTLSKVTITLTPSNQTASHSFNLTIIEDSDKTDKEDLIAFGKILSDEMEVEQKFFVESGKSVDAQAEGTLTIYNKRNSAQTLVATTRLLTPNKILFRLKDKVTIPANSEIQAKIYADQLGASGNIPPTTFTIPGLSESLQKLVYAKSTATMAGGTRQIGVLTQQDIDKSQQELIKNNGDKILSKFIDDLSDNNLTLADTQITINELSYDKELGEELDSFTLKGKLIVQAVFVKRQEVLDIAKTQLKKSQGPKGEFISVDPSSLQYQLIEIDMEKTLATLKITLSGLATLDPNKNIFDKNLLVGFTQDDLKLYFSQFESIQDVKVKFSPFWVKKVPILKDHIIIQIEK